VQAHHIPRGIMEHEAEVFESDYTLKGLRQTTAKAVQVAVAGDGLRQGKEGSVNFGIGLTVDCDHVCSFLAPIIQQVESALAKARHLIYP
jgi:hypothetical protein